MRTLTRDTTVDTELSFDQNYDMIFFLYFLAIPVREHGLRPTTLHNVRMGAAKGGIVGVAHLAIGAIIYSWWFASPKHEEETEPSSPQHQTRRYYSNPNNNNHDHVKFNHSARVSAEAEELGRRKNVIY